MKKRWFLCGTGVLFAADQILKSYSENSLEKGQEKKLTEHIVLRRVSNEGMCLGVLSSRPKIVKVFSAAATGGVTLWQMWALFRTKGIWKKKGISLLAAGAWSNTFDRLARGYVVDYIGFRAGNRKLASVTYNLADFFIAAGTVILSAASLLTGKKRRKRAEKAAS